MIDFSVTVAVDSVVGGLDKLEYSIRRAEDAAARETARTIVIPAVKEALSYSGPSAPIGRLGVVTGRTRSKVRARFWRNRSGLLNGSVRVMGNRAHIARFHEKGTRSHGRHAGPLPARRMFEITGRLIRARCEEMLVESFERNLQTKLRASLL